MTNFIAMHLDHIIEGAIAILGTGGALFGGRKKMKAIATLILHEVKDGLEEDMKAHPEKYAEVIYNHFPRRFKPFVTKKFLTNLVLEVAEFSDSLDKKQP